MRLARSGSCVPLGIAQPPTWAGSLLDSPGCAPPSQVSLEEKTKHMASPVAFVVGARPGILAHERSVSCGTYCTTLYTFSTRSCWSVQNVDLGEILHTVDEAIALGVRRSRRSRVIVVVQCMALAEDMGHRGVAQERDGLCHVRELTRALFARRPSPLSGPGVRPSRRVRSEVDLGGERLVRGDLEDPTAVAATRPPARSRRGTPYIRARAAAPLVVIRLLLRTTTSRCGNDARCSS